VGRCVHAGDEFSWRRRFGEDQKLKRFRFAATCTLRNDLVNAYFSIFSQQNEKSLLISGAGTKK
jgi:hypothetical protein